MNVATISRVVRVAGCTLAIVFVSSSGNSQSLFQNHSHAGAPNVGKRAMGLIRERIASPDPQISPKVPVRASDGAGGGRRDFRIATVIEVTNTDNSGFGSLRKAIDSANASPGLDMITFNIPASGVLTISPLSSLPNIVDPVVIDGTTQPGYSGTPLIEINGSQAGVSVNGLTIYAGNCTVRGLAINSFIGTGPPNYFNGMGIYIDVNGGNRIEGCFLGTDATGMIARPNGGVGVGIFGGGAGNIIGGTGPLQRNVLSGNVLHGIQISPGTTGRNVVQGNLIGLNATGTGGLGNGQAGIAIFGSVFGDTIGGTAPGSRNVISADSLEGIYVYTGLSGMVIQGNYIGTDISGTARLGNVYEGIYLDGAPRNFIGGLTAQARNVISANGDAGVYIYNSAGSGNIVQGNYLGTNAAGTDTLGNNFGVFLDHAPNDTIGTAGAGGNVISGNHYAGIYVYYPTSSGNAIQANYIGTDLTGNNDRGNLRYGIVLDSAANNIIGGTVSLSGNVISGNDSAGIYIVGATATGNKVKGNYIGTKADGVTALPNLKGVYIDNAPRNIVGGTTPTERNLLSGNSWYGVETRNAGATGNRIMGNSIGVDAAGTGALGNGSYGVLIGSSQDTIGGTTASMANIIAYNHGAGVFDTSGSGNLIRLNSIFTNYGGLGIDLGSRGLARNDSLDPDNGPNGLQNFPLLDSAVVAGGTTTVHGRFNSKPHIPFTLDFYSNAKYDSSHFGEGETYLWSSVVTTNDSGNANINVVMPLAVPLDRYITATATDTGGSTSEFSQCLCLSDSDKDGIMDSWETQGWGIDVNGDSLIDLDLYALGARTQHKDLFLEVDAMVGLVPRQLALDTVVAAFSKVPNSLVNNPDGKPGIKLHIDPLDADTTIPVANWPNRFTDFDNVKKVYFGTKAQRTSPDSTYILQAKNLVYRYCIFGRTYGVGADTGSSGLAELANGLGGNDFMVTLGSVGPTGWNGGRLVDQAGTLMHEMGHTLGLWHGGNNNQNYKPNYVSIMNYAWQTVFYWQPPGSWRLNYSTDSLPTLNEASLNETVGLGTPGPYVPYAVVAVPFTDSLRNIRWARMKPATAVDWTGNGDSTRVSANVDINLVGERPAVTTPNQQLNGFVDWPHIVYNFRNSPNFQPGVHNSPLAAADSELTYETFLILNSLPPPKPAGQFIMDGVLDTSAVLLASNAGINLYGRIKGGQLYVATSSAQSQAADMFIFVAVAPGSLQNAPWLKTGQVAGWSAFLGNESTNNSASWYDASDAPLTNITVDSASTTVLEGVIDLELLTGGEPARVYLAVGKYQTNDGGALLAQVPVGNGNGNIESNEFYQFDTALPIQLASFTATALSSTRVRLDWSTLSELNNFGFEIQRKRNGETEFQTLPGSFVAGHGTTIEPHSYSFTDTTVTSGAWRYRLKQTDFDGTVHFGPEVVVDAVSGVFDNSLPKIFALYQNYPNPFNPTTTLRYDVATPSQVSLKVFNVLGQEVATLVNGRQEPGRYSVEWNASGVASGVYLFRLEAGPFVEIRKMAVIR